MLIPARISRAQEARWVSEMVSRLTSSEAVGRRRGAGRSDHALEARCRALSDRYLDGRAAPASVRWVASMRTRWASCTPEDSSIRVSERLRSVPSWVLDYVLVHELAHLQISGHDTAFWSLVARYPRAERARGYLDGLSAGAALPFQQDLGDDVDSLVAASTGELSSH